MEYIRRYVQYNDLVFDSADMVETDTYTSKTKSWDREYTFRHGSYYPLKRQGAMWQMGHVTMTLNLDADKLPCEDRPYYVRFAKAQLQTPGKLWAVQGTELLWAYAVITSIREYQSKRWERVSFDVDFDLPEGVWHKADKQRTFMMPYDICDYMDCFDVPDVRPCNSSAYDDYCCNQCDGEVVNETFCDCCQDDCDHITKDMAYCYHTDDLRGLQACDSWAWRLKYDCAAAKKFFSDFLSDERLGQKFCSSCGKVASGYLLGETDIPTDSVRITLYGRMKNPYVEINGNGNWIHGEYEGVLVIDENMDVYYYKDEQCMPCDPLPLDVYVTPPGMQYGWTVHQGRNRVVVDFGDCCAGCAYIEIDSLTY